MPTNLKAWLEGLEGLPECKCGLSYRGYMVTGGPLSCDACKARLAAFPVLLEMMKMIQSDLVLGSAMEYALLSLIPEQP